MCDYRQTSLSILKGLSVKPGQVHRILGHRACRELRHNIQKGCARYGRDLRSGEVLPSSELSAGHYMTPINFHRAIVEMQRNPQKCQWCGEQLPAGLVLQHRVPHDQREHIRHHFHPECWKARLLAVAIIFGHIRPDRFLSAGGVNLRGRKITVRETITLTIKRALRLKNSLRHGKKAKGTR